MQADDLQVLLCAILEADSSLCLCAAAVEVCSRLENYILERVYLDIYQLGNIRKDARKISVQYEML